MKNTTLIQRIMLISGGLSALSFLLSLAALKFFPGAFKWLALGMVVMALIFFVFHTLNNYNETYRIRPGRRENKKE
ncbi:MAG: hypothetical protein ACOYXB_02840 [Bacteroidota bacterium]